VLLQLLHKKIEGKTMMWNREGRPDIIYFFIMESLNEGRNKTKIKLKQRYNKEWDDLAARVCVRLFI